MNDKKNSKIIETLTECIQRLEDKFMHRPNCDCKRCWEVRYIQGQLEEARALCQK